MQVLRDEALRPYNTLALQARAQALVTVACDAELKAALGWARERNLPVVPLGEGSNVVLAGEVNALVVRQQSRGVQVLDSGAESVTLRVAAGENWHELVRWSLQQGYVGLENLALIPGTVGAAPIQNIGAYGVELQSVLLRVHATHIADDTEVVLDKADCGFGYRESVFKQALRDQLFITAVDLQLSLEPNVNITYPALADFFAGHPHIEPTPQAVFDTVVGIRRSKLPDPSVDPNAGSFFKNPVLSRELAARLVEKYPALPCYPQQDGAVKVPAAWMIEHCGWKGFRRNHLGVHPKHALVLVNYGSDSGEKLLAMANNITASVNNTFGVQLEIEPRVYGVGV